MADIYEFVLAMDLRGDLPDEELAELRWHMGHGPRPERLTMGTDRFLETYPLGDPSDPDCVWETEEPTPLFDRRGAGHAIGGALVADLVRRRPEGWSLTIRQECHPDDVDRLTAALDWLGPRSVHAGVRDVPFYVGHLRFHETTEVMPLVLVNGHIALPEGLPGASLGPDA